MASVSGLPIPSDFITSYNGIVFPPEDTLTTSFKITPVQTADKRSIAYNAISIGIRTVIVGQPTDSKVILLRQKLTKQGGVFIYGGRGFGPLNINTGKIKDIMYGPVPKVLSLSPLGYRNACRLDWEVTIHIPECPDAAYLFRAMDFSYSASHQIRKDGRVNVVTTGELVIPNNRILAGTAIARGPYDNPDEYREKIAPPPRFGFQREWGPFTVDPTRTRLSFSWTDKEFGRNVYPPGIVECKVSQGGQSVSKGFASFNLTLNASYKLAADAEPNLAFRHFWNVVVQDRVRGRSGKYKGSTVASIAFIPMSFSFSDPDIYGEMTEANFSLGYLIAGTTIQDVLTHAGMWEKISGDYRLWAASLANTALSPYGLSRVAFDIGSDRIINLCEAGAPPRPVPGGRPEVRELKGGPRFEPPASSTSWITYVNAIRVEGDSGVVSTSPLSGSKSEPELRGGSGGPTPPGAWRFDGSKALPAKPGIDPFFAPPKTAKKSFSAAIGGKLDASSSGSSTAGDDKFTRRTSGSVVVFMTGHALRAGFAIPCPVLADINGVRPVLSNRTDRGEGFVTQIVHDAGVPIVGAKWNLRYILPRMPEGGIPVPPNPLG
jgi:hypothetical protein